MKVTRLAPAMMINRFNVRNPYLSCGHLVRRISARSGAICDQQRGPGAPDYDVIEPLATPPSTRTAEGKSSSEI